MVNNPNILIVSKNCNERSFLVNSILQYLKKVHADSELLVITSSYNKKSFYSAIFPDATIKHKLSDSLLEQTISEGHISTKNKIVVFDDCFFEYKIFNERVCVNKSWLLNNNIKDILSNQRHYRMPVITIFSNPMLIPPSLRAQFDYVFIMGYDDDDIMLHLWSNYAPVFPSIISFKKVLKEWTVFNRAMVIDNRCRYDCIQNKVLWINLKTIEIIKFFHYFVKTSK